MRQLHSKQISTLQWIAASALLVAALAGVALMVGGHWFEESTVQVLAPTGEIAMQQALGTGGSTDEFYRKKLNAHSAALPAQF